MIDPLQFSTLVSTIKNCGKNTPMIPSLPHIWRPRRRRFVSTSMIITQPRLPPLLRQPLQLPEQTMDQRLSQKSRVSQLSIKARTTTTKPMSCSVTSMLLARRRILTQLNGGMRERESFHAYIGWRATSCQSPVCSG